MQSKPKPPGARQKPAAGRPSARERILSGGAASMRDEELIALLLRTGTQGADVRALAGQLADGGLRALGRIHPDELCMRPGIGPAKAATLAAAVEIARRWAAQRVQRGDIVRTPADVHRHFHSQLRDAAQEEFHVVLLDGRNRWLRSVLCSRGTLTSSLVHPREVFRPALRESAAGVTLVHNHPSGDPTPSEQDRLLTRRLAEAGKLLGIWVMDHIIVAEHGYASMRDESHLWPD